MNIRVTGITAEQDGAPPVGDAALAAFVAFGLHEPGPDAVLSLDGMPIALGTALPPCVDTLLRYGPHLLTITHDGAGEWSARLLTRPGTRATVRGS